MQAIEHRPSRAGRVAGSARWSLPPTTTANRSTVKLGYIFAVLNAVLSGVAVFVSSYGVGLFSNAVLYTSLKNAVAGAILLVPFALVRGLRRETKKLSGRDWAWLLVVAIVGGSVPYALFFTGLKMTNAVTGSLGDHLQFVIVVVLAVVVLGERMSKTMWAGMAVLLAGVLLSTSLGLVRWGQGTLLIVISTLLFSVEWVIVKHLLRGRLSPLTVMTAKMTLGSVMLFGYLAARGQLAPVAHLDWEQWSYVLLTGVILMMFTASIFVAIRFASVSAVMAIGSGAPLVTVALQLFTKHHVNLSGQAVGLWATLLAVVAILVAGLRHESTAAGAGALEAAAGVQGRG
jgi:drug/metabolite transporter (DMT)-like permease